MWKGTCSSMVSRTGLSGSFVAGDGTSLQARHQCQVGEAVPGWASADLGGDRVQQEET